MLWRRSILYHEGANPLLGARELNRRLPRREWTLLIVLIFALAHSLSPRASRAEECDRLKLSLQISEPALPLHAPVFAALEILNEGTLPASLDLGKNSKGNLRLVLILPDGGTINRARRSPGGAAAAGASRWDLLPGQRRRGG